MKGVCVACNITHVTRRVVSRKHDVTTRSCADCWLALGVLYGVNARLVNTRLDPIMDYVTSCVM